MATTTTASRPETRPIPSTTDEACNKYRTRICRNCVSRSFSGACYCYCECPDNIGRKGDSYSDPHRTGRTLCKHKNHKRSSIWASSDLTRAKERREAANQLHAKALNNIDRLYGPAKAAPTSPQTNTTAILPTPKSPLRVCIDEEKAAASRKAIALSYGVNPKLPDKSWTAWLELT